MNNDAWVVHELCGAVCLTSAMPVPNEFEWDDSEIDQDWLVLRHTPPAYATPTPLFGLSPGEAAPVSCITDESADADGGFPPEETFQVVALNLDLSRIISLEGEKK